MFKLGVAVLGTAILLTQPAHAGDAEAGKSLVIQGNGKGAVPCMTCHGTEGAGNAAAGFPALAGMNADYLSRQLRDYRDGRRQNPIMQPIAATLSDEEMANAAAWYASQTPPAPAAAPAAEQAATGERLATVGAWDREVPPCASCHGPNGRGVGATFPELAGQHASYLSAQFAAWKSGNRSNDPQNLMKGVAERLTDAEIQAVAAWFAAQPR